ncbi:hypothetical protein BH18CHL1_BH18CHL1_10260 [soil metagenome]
MMRSMDRISVIVVATVALLLSACGSPGGPNPNASPAQTPITTDAPSQGTPSAAGDATSAPEPTAAASGGPSGRPSPSDPPSAPAATSSAEPPVISLAWTGPIDAGPSTPGPRSDHTWTVDPAGGIAYLFGGTGPDGPSDDLWAYDLAADAWSLIEPGGDRPAARFGHVAAWVDGIGLVIWSGQAGSTFFNDLWAYQPAGGDWRRLPDRGEVPSARYGSCAALGPDGRLWISHGFTDAGRFDDTRAYDFSAESWSEVTVDGERPIKRCLHDCFWSADGRLVLYAGQTDGVSALGDLWALEAATGRWTQEPRPEPEPRQLYALAARDGVAYILGGADRDRAPLDSMFTLDLTTLAWQRAEPSGGAPPPRSNATLVADPERGRLLLYGGMDRAGGLPDLWALQTP